jgi:hypothetical protein
MLPVTKGAPKCVIKIFDFSAKIETDYVIILLKFLLQIHDLWTMFHSKTDLKSSIWVKLHLPQRCLFYHLDTVVHMVREMR